MLIYNMREKELKADSEMLVKLAKREALLRRVLNRGRGSSAERQELREVLDSRREIITRLDIRKVTLS